MTTWQRLCPLELRDEVLARVEACLSDPATLACIEGHEARAEYPKEVMDRLRAAGWVELLVDSGQSGVSSRATAYHLNALNVLTARASGSIGIGAGIVSLAMLPFYAVGNPELLKEVSARLRRGSVAGLLLTEWDAGSNLLRTATVAEPGRLEGQAFVPTARAEATHFRVRGEKHLINGGVEADVLVTLVRTREPAPADSPFGATGHLSLLWLDRGPEVSALPRYATVPAPAADISGVRFGGAVVPISRLLGKEGAGFQVVQRTLTVSRGGIAALAAGAASSALGQALEHARTRNVYGAPILELGAIREHLAHLVALDLACACLSLKSVALVNALGTRAAHHTAVAKYACTALAEEAVSEGRRVLGARALVRTLPYARLLGDVLLYPVFDGTSHVMLDQVQARLTAIADGRGLESDPLARLREAYAAAPRRLVEVLRGDGRPFLVDPQAHAQRLSQLEGTVDLEPLVRVSGGLNDAVRALRAQRVWAEDQAVRFALAKVASLLEAALAVAELGDPPRRRALGMAPARGDQAQLALAAAYAVPWLGARASDELSAVARTHGLELGAWPHPLERFGPARAALLGALASWS